MPSKGFDSEPPSHPHFVCRDGYWWHHDHKRHECFAGATSLARDDLEACCNGSAFKRGERISLLTLGELLAIFREKCICGSNHRIGADNLARAFRAIPPELHKAVEHLPAMEFISLATIRGSTEEETRHAMAMHAAKAAAGGVRKGRSSTRKAAACPTPAETNEP